MTHNPIRFSLSVYESPSHPVHFLQLPLEILDSVDVRGIYGKKKNLLPERMLYLDPVAATEFCEFLAHRVVVSDMFRSAEASLRARKNRKGAQRPGYSGHNFGLSIDLDIGKSIKRARVKNKRGLDELMAANGWFCHRRDHKRDFEAWHYNYFGSEFDSYVKPKDKRTSAGLERMITATHGHWWDSLIGTKAVQRWLTRVGLYDGDLDGKLGPISKSGLSAFQRAWLLPATGKIDKRTKRTLAFVTADKHLIG